MEFIITIGVSTSKPIQNNLTLCNKEGIYIRKGREKDRAKQTNKQTKTNDEKK
jgi:hypothetical protein